MCSIFKSTPNPWYLCALMLLPMVQAVWGREWLTSHANLAAMQPGWTYMFEAVYQHNTHVVRYPFECLVLLGAVSPEGAELPDAAARQQLAAQLGVMAVPSIEGSLPELLQMLGRGCCTSDEAHASNDQESGSNGDGGESSSNRSTNNFEGWVVQSEQQRCKLVLQQFQQLSYAAGSLLHPLVVWYAAGSLLHPLVVWYAAGSLLHPLVVWYAVFRGQSRVQLAEGLPVHFAAELDAILTALDRQFWAVQKLLEQQLASSATSSNSDGGGSSSSRSVVPSPDIALALASETVSRVAAASDTIPASHAERPPAATADDDTAAASEVCSVTGSTSVLGTPQFADALKYAVDKGTAAVSSMFWDSRTSSSSSSAPALCGRILECIRPGLDGSLPGYTPSPAFKQTYAKGWARGLPAGCRVLGVAPEPLIMQQLTDQALAAVLGKLQGRDVGSALRVCRGWCALVQGDPALRAAAEKAAAERRESERNLCYSSADSYDHYDDYRGWRAYGYYGGYGSG
jgi:hypothetical protein